MRDGYVNSAIDPAQEGTEPGMSPLDLAGLEAKALWVRRKTLDMIASGGSGHIGGSYSCTEILVSLYYGGLMKQDPRNPGWEERDRFIASKGHGALGLYPVLADLGYFPVSELDGYLKRDSILSGHPDTRVPGVETVTGSIGNGLGIGAGMALGGRLKGNPHRTFVLLGDGECQEGAIWESAYFAAQHKLSNLTAIVDNNGITATNHTAGSVTMEPMADKWAAGGWDVQVVDGHSFEALLEALNDDGRDDERPRAIVAQTTKGKGVSFMEDDPAWHHGVPNEEQIELARAELQ